MFFSNHTRQRKKYFLPNKVRKITENEKTTLGFFFPLSPPPPVSEY